MQLHLWEKNIDLYIVHLYSSSSLLFSTRQRDWSTASVDTTTLHRCCSSCTGCQCQNEWLSNFASWCIAVCMVSALNISRQRLRSASSTDVVVPATRRSSLGDRAFHGARAWNALPPSVTSAPSLSSFRRLMKTFFSSDNCVNNTNYCVVVLKRLAVSTTLILANWTELNWTEHAMSLAEFEVIYQLLIMPWFHIFNTFSTYFVYWKSLFTIQMVAEIYKKYIEKNTINYIKSISNC